ITQGEKVQAVLAKKPQSVWEILENVCRDYDELVSEGERVLEKSQSDPGPSDELISVAERAQIDLAKSKPNPYSFFEEAREVNQALIGVNRNLREDWNSI